MDSITYAPVIEPVTGNYDLYCVALKWTDNPGTPLASVKASGDATAANFKRLSNGKFTFNVDSREISVPYAHDAKNVPDAVAYGKKLIAATGKYVTYAFVNNNAETNSHSGGDTSNILDALTTTFYHEIGRDDPINLGSSGAFEGNPPVYVDQADGTTFMGHFASDELTACQLYGLGWLGNQQMALYDVNGGAQQFTIYGLSASIGANNLMAVMIPSSAITSEKNLFLSRPTFKDGQHNCLHLGVGDKYRGTERVAVFGAQPYTYQGLVFTQVAADTNANTVTIEIKKAN